MTRSNVFSCSWKISCVGKGIRDSSSCELCGSSPGVRRMKKLIRSTLGSFLRSWRRKRTSQEGRPTTSSTRTRSRITLSTNDRALFWTIASPSYTGTLTVKANFPVRSGTKVSFTSYFEWLPSTWIVFCATTCPSRRSTTGTSMEENPRAVTSTSTVTWLRTNAKSSTATFSTARSLRACAPTGSAKSGAFSLRSSAAAAGERPCESSALSVPSLATKIPASGRPPVPLEAAEVTAARMSVADPCGSAGRRPNSAGCRSRSNPYTSTWNLPASCARSPWCCPAQRMSSSARVGPAGEAGNFIDRLVSKRSATRARTRLSARSSIPGSSSSTSTSSAAARRKASRAKRRGPVGSLRKPRKESHTAAPRAATASASTQPGSVESEVMRQALYALSGISDPPPLHDEGDVHLVLLVVEAQGVHGDVDAEPDGLLPLQLPTGRDLELPGPQRIPGQGTHQVVPRIENGEAATQLEALQIRCGSDAASGPVEQVERLVEDVIPGHARELPAGDEPRDDLARRLLESGAARGAGIVEQQEASVAEVAPQLGDLAVGGRGDRLIAGEDREGIAEEVRVGERDRLHHRGGLDARALGDLPGEAREPVRPGIPTACVADLGEGDAGGVAKSENAAGRESGAQTKQCPA